MVEFCGRLISLQFSGVFHIWIKKNNRIFREVERLGDNVWDEARFNASLWAFVTKSFHNYELGHVFLA